MGGFTVRASLRIIIRSILEIPSVFLFKISAFIKEGLYPFTKVDLLLTELRETASILLAGV